MNFVWAVEVRVTSGWKPIHLILGGYPVKTDYLFQFAKLSVYYIDDLRIRRIRTTTEFNILDNSMKKSSQWTIDSKYKNWLDFDDGKIRKIAAVKF